MRIKIESTGKIVDLNGVPARVWEGESDHGTKVICFITRIAVKESEPPEVHARFKSELQEHRPPSSEANAFPLRMIL